MQKNDVDLITSTLTKISGEISTIRKEQRQDIYNLRHEMEVRDAELNNSICEIRNVISGNGTPGLKVENDRNTQFRKFLSKMLWVLFTPLYGGMIGFLFIIIKHAAVLLSFLNGG